MNLYLMNINDIPIGIATINAPIFNSGNVYFDVNESKTVAIETDIIWYSDTSICLDTAPIELKTYILEAQTDLIKFAYHTSYLQRFLSNIFHTLTSEEKIAFKTAFYDLGKDTRHDLKSYRDILLSVICCRLYPDMNIINSEKYLDYLKENFRK